MSQSNLGFYTLTNHNKSMDFRDTEAHFGLFAAYHSSLIPCNSGSLGRRI